MKDFTKGSKKQQVYPQPTIVIQSVIWNLIEQQNNGKCIKINLLSYPFFSKLIIMIYVDAKIDDLCLSLYCR